MLQASYQPYTFNFNFPGGTSRGVLNEKPSWFISIWDDENPLKVGTGEISLIPGLSPESPELVECYLNSFCQNPNALIAQFDNLKDPAIKFGVETALTDLKSGGTKELFPSEFTKGIKGIRINGLVWMGNKEEMLLRLNEKVKSGFTCIKIKVGAINFHEELSLLKYIREAYTEKDLEIRVDANGAFQPEQALEKIDALAKFKLHSIEQPIKQGQYEQIANICNKSAIPVALDEELIGIHDNTYKQQLLHHIKPQHIVLKPSLIGGLYETQEWGKLAQSLNIGWWVTSALEGNIGLNAIAQWTFTHGSEMPQGLGTGQVFSNNISSPLKIQGQELWYDKSTKWEKVKTQPHKKQFKNSNYQSCDVQNDPKNYNKITLNGTTYNLDIVDWDSFEKTNYGLWWNDIIAFLKQWSNKSETIELKTSGTTGKPKTMQIEKHKLLVSASKTCNYFNLSSHSNALLCLSANYIAGKMMLVRGLISGMNIICVEPSNNPVKNLDTEVHFAAMVPMQVQTCMGHKNFNNIQQLIIGGGRLNNTTIKKLMHTKVKAYETFGMTETLSHIALKQLVPNKEDYFTALADISIQQDYNNNMVLDYPELGIYKFKTNDIIEMANTNNKFKWIGRSDFIINSGGIKISPEELEAKIANLIDHPFCIVGKPDEKLGEKLVLIIEAKPFDTELLLKKLKKSLPSYQSPKCVVFVNKIPTTDSGKIQRKKIFQT